MFITHATERMALHAAQMEESQKFYYRVKTAVLRLINRSPALRSILAPITRNPRLNPKERHALENSALRQRHTRERAMIERENRSMAAVDARELKALHQALHRKITETDMHSPSLMTRPAHENEPLHRLHRDLLELRHEQEQAQGLAQTFNLKADPRKKRRTNDDWTVKPDPHPHKRPKGHND